MLRQPYKAGNVAEGNRLKMIQFGRKQKKELPLKMPMNIGINIKAISLNIKMQNNTLMQLIILLEVRQKEL